MPRSEPVDSQRFWARQRFVKWIDLTPLPLLTALLTPPSIRQMDRSSPLAPTQSSPRLCASAGNPPPATSASATPACPCNRCILCPRTPTQPEGRYSYSTQTPHLPHLNSPIGPSTSRSTSTPSTDAAPTPHRSTPSRLPLAFIAPDAIRLRFQLSSHLVFRPLDKLQRVFSETQRLPHKWESWSGKYRLSTRARIVHSPYLAPHHPQTLPRRKPPPPKSPAWQL